MMRDQQNATEEKMTKQDYEQAKRAEYQASHMVAFAQMAAEAGFEVKIVTEDWYVKRGLSEYSLSVTISMPYQVNGTDRKFSTTVSPADRTGWYTYHLFHTDRQAKDPEALVQRLLEAVDKYREKAERYEAEKTKEKEFAARVLGIVTMSGQAAQESELLGWDYTVGNTKLELDADAGLVTVQMNLKPEEFAKLMALGLTVEK